MSKALKFIVDAVKEWPSDTVTGVRVDYDGEICFTSEDDSIGTLFDTTPEGFHYEKHYEPTKVIMDGLEVLHELYGLYGFTNPIGTEFTREQYEDTKKRLDV